MSDMKHNNMGPVRPADDEAKAVSIYIRCHQKGKTERKEFMEYCIYLTRFPISQVFHEVKKQVVEKVSFKLK